MQHLDFFHTLVFERDDGWPVVITVNDSSLALIGEKLLKYGGFPVFNDAFSRAEYDEVVNERDLLKTMVESNERSLKEALDEKRIFMPDGPNEPCDCEPDDSDTWDQELDGDIIGVEDAPSSDWPYTISRGEMEVSAPTMQEALTMMREVCNE